MKQGIVLLVALAAVACTPDEEGACSGGGTVSAAIGTEEIVGQFVAYEDGDTVPLEDGPSLSFDYEVTGIDAEQVVGVVLRISRDGDTATVDYLANANMRCADPGPARYGAVAPWPDTWPEPETLDGTGITVETVFTDVGNVSADVTVDLLLDANP